MDIKHSHQTRLPKTWLILWDEIKESEKFVWIGLRSPSYWSTTTSHPWLPQFSPLYLLHSTCEQYWMLQWPFSVDVFQIIPLCCLLLTECCSVCTLVRCTSFLRVFLRNGVTLCIAWCEHTTDSNTSGKEVKKLSTNLSFCERLLSGFFLTVLPPWSWTSDWPLWSPLTLGTPVSPSVSMATTLASGPLSAHCRDSGTTKASSFWSLASVLTIW